MKISKELYNELRVAVGPFMHVNSGNTVRQRWDILWCAVDSGRFDMRKTYDAGLNDEHVDTALRKIMGV